jgi:hypothetical protein
MHRIWLAFAFPILFIGGIAVGQHDAAPPPAAPLCHEGAVAPIAGQVVNCGPGERLEVLTVKDGVANITFVCRCPGPTATAR